MPTFDTKPLLDALSVPVGELIASVGRGVAEAQREMDLASIAALQQIYGDGEGLFLELQRIGYRPTWYHIPEVEGELQVALTVTGEETRNSTGSTSASTRSKIKLYAAPVDAGYASRFGFTLQATSRIKFRVVPVPPSTSAEALQVAPALVGLTLGEAKSRLVLLGIAGELPSAPDAARVSAQEPAAGTLLPTGGTVTVRIA